MPVTRAALLQLAGTAIFLLALLALTLRPYGGNVSALLHMYEGYGRQYDLPPAIVLYRDGGYDGMLYYQLARDLPALVAGESVEPPRGALREDAAYRAQRILLPALTWLASAGQERRFPAAILAINVACLLAALALAIAALGPGVHAASVVLNPASLIGLLYACTEPLALMLTTAFLFLWDRSGRRLTGLHVTTLALAMLARETTLFVVVALALYLTAHRRLREAAYSLAALVPWLLWQAFLWQRLGRFGFGHGEGMVNVPLTGPLALLATAPGDLDTYTMSALAFLVAFVLPLAALLAAVWLRRPRRADAALSLATFQTAAALSLDAHIWSVISAVGRVLPGLYPAYAFTAAQRSGTAWTVLSWLLCAVGVCSGVGVALSSHPFTLS